MIEKRSGNADLCGCIVLLPTKKKDEGFKEEEKKLLLGICISSQFGFSIVDLLANFIT